MINKWMTIKLVCCLLLFACSLGISFPVKGQLHEQVNLEELPALPQGEGRDGVLLGTLDDRLFYMGGRTASGETSDRIWYLQEGKTAWELAPERLPKPLSHGLSLTYNERIIIAGGTDGKTYSPDVYTISLHKGNLRIDHLPALPVPLVGATGAILGNTFLVAGGTTAPAGEAVDLFMALDLSVKAGWQRLKSWPGPSRTGAVSASMKGDFYLFGGYRSTQHPGGQYDRPAASLNDAFRFIPAFVGGKLTGGTWERLPELPWALAKGPGPALSFGLDHLLFPGRADSLPGGAGDFPARADSLGEAEDILIAYNTETGTWLDFGPLPAANWGGPAVKTEQGWLMPGNMQGRAAVVSFSKKKEFGWINWLTLLVYLAMMLWIGFVHDKKEKQTTNNFFTAGGRIPWWAAGLSIYGTQLSAITFMAIPAIVFATDWSLAIGSVLILATVPIVVRYYIPFFRRLSITSAYEYLEHRFNRSVRLLGSISFILFQLGRMGIVLYLPAVAIASVTGSDIYTIIAIMGIICIVYTVMGGIEAVIWTDFAQVLVLMGGAIVCLIVGIAHVDGGLQKVISQGMAEGKFTLFHLGWKPDSLVLWVCIVGFFFLNIIPYTSDQTIVQRYLTVKDEKSAAKSLWTNSLITLPGTLVFFGLGTVLYVFYQNNPAVIASDKVDEILPYFVVQELPAGVAGLVIAGVFAASQSTLSSSMNSIAASYTSDIYQPFRVASTDRKNLRVARWVTVGSGIVGTGSAMLIALLDVQFIFNLFQEVLGILGGSLAGVFILGIFTKKANAAGVISGLIIGALAVWWVKTYTDISVYLYGAISVLACIMAGYLISLLVPRRK